MKKRQVVSMIRVSTPGQATDDRKGLNRQREDIAVFQDSYGLEIKRQFEIVMSGTDVHRTRDFHTMLEVLKRPEIAGVVVPSIDRLSRDHRLSSMALFKVFEETGKFLFCDLGEMDLNNPQHTLIIWIMINQAGNERKAIKHRTLNAREKMRLDPKTSIDKRPKGVVHKRVNEKINYGEFEYDDYATMKILPAFNRLLKGDTLFTITEELGFPSVPALRYTLKNRWWIGYKTRLHKIIDRVWSPEDERWAGGKRVLHDKPIVERTNLADTPLVSPAVFERVQELLAINHDTHIKRKTRLNDFLAAGLLFCKCGSKMYHKKRRGGRNLGGHPKPAIEGHFKTGQR
ncbi:MAG: recombinase family protein [Acidobacteriia bacterium]|nr:recombinase family protein [Terriglobia bacterium]